MEALSEPMGPEVGRRKPIWLTRVPFTLFVTVAAIGLSIARWEGALISLVGSTARILDGQYWCLITSTFFHGEMPHLGPNVMLFLLMGLPIECRYGWWRTALLYGVLAIGSSAASCLAGGLGIGMSGVLYGYWGLLLVTGNRANGPKVEFPRFITVVLLLSIILSIVGYFMGDTRTGHVAHGAGLAIGLAIGFALRAARPLKWLVLVAAASLALAPATLYMPWNYEWWKHRAYVLNGRGEWQQALVAGRRAVVLAPDDWVVGRLMSNMGKTELRLKHYEEAIDWFTRAADVTEFRPEDKIELAAAFYRTHQEYRARQILLQVNESDLSPRTKKDPFYSWYLNWARISATQPSTRSGKDAQRLEGVDEAAIRNAVRSLQEEKGWIWEMLPRSNSSRPVQKTEP